jgi:hypothetical protein
MTVALARVLAVAWIFAAASGASAEEGGRGVKIGIMSDVNGRPPPIPGQGRPRPKWRSKILARMFSASLSKP